MNEDQDLIEEVKTKIVAKYSISESKAKEYAIKLIDQIDRHGGNSRISKQTDLAIEFVVKGWIEDGY